MRRVTDLVVTARGRWPESDADSAPPALAGFVASTFSPLAAEVARRCLTQAYEQPPAPADRGARTAVIISSASGDATTATEVARAVDGGRRLGPLLFFQAVPNAVAGYVAARWELGGPVVSLSPGGASAGESLAEGMAEGMEMASLLIRDGDADEALIVVVEQATDGGRDHALAVLVRSEQ
jgi:3-oxoacyl-(acyl-carrier-protein) synthase